MRFSGLTWVVLLTLATFSCGARSALYFDERDGGIDAGDAAPPPPDASHQDAGDAGPDAGDAGCIPIPDDEGCGAVEICENGDDDDCDGLVDEDCPCAPGAVQPCFPAAPGKRHVGACVDGTQICEGTSTWGPCTGAILPSPDVCNGTDNLCNGCSARRDCPIDCPSPGDERIPDGHPLEDYPLRGGSFYAGAVRTWQWSVTGGPCDGIAPNLDSFELRDASSRNATFYPLLSGDYTVTLRVTTLKGTVLTCQWVVHVEGPGLRVEMCYPESETQDLDLFLHRPNDSTEWYVLGGTSYDVIPDAACGWHNCEATIRGDNPRADWGYEPSPITECNHGPQGDQWEDLGYCANPRLDVDNNLDEGIGLPENINVDAPRDGETFRIMVQNFSGTLAHPIVNVYCSGRRLATYGAEPDRLVGFQGVAGWDGIGAMWRVADVTTRVDAASGTVGCEVAGLHPPGSDRGYDVTYGDPRY